MTEQQYKQKLTHEYVNRVRSGKRSLESLKQLGMDIKATCTSGPPPHLVPKDIAEMYRSICEAITVLQA